MGSWIQMGKVKTKSLKLSMTITFLITICIIAVMSALTIFAANKLQQELLKKQYLMISSPDFRIDEIKIQLHGSLSVREMR